MNRPFLFRGNQRLVVVVAIALLLGACVKLSENNPSNPPNPDNTDEKPSPEPAIKYVYPFGKESQTVTTELILTFSDDVDLSTVGVEIPPLKFNKSLLVMLSQDDCKQAAFSTTWAAIHGRLLSNTYFYNAAQMRGGDLPPDVYSLGKTLGSTDGTGREVRFSFTTSLSPEWAYMEEKPDVKPGFISNFYRFYMKAGLLWIDVAEMTNYGVGIAFHDLKTEAVNKQDSLLAHYQIAQARILNRLSGRGCKMLAEPDGNKTYTDAALRYAPIQTIVLQGNDGLQLKPFATGGDLTNQPLQRRFYAPRDLRPEVEAQMKLPVAERQAVNIGVHGTDKSWVEFLLWLNDNYGKDGEDCVWMPSIEEYYEYNYLRCHAILTKQIEGNSMRLKIEMPGEMYFYYPSLTLNFSGLKLAQCLDVDADERVTGLSWGLSSRG